nr:hypothetical protein [Candidatus Sigynarchaeota archaeon]
MGNLTKLGWEDLRNSFPYVREVFEQAGAIHDFIDFYKSAPGYALLADALNRWNGVRYTNVVIAGMGSSMFAGHIAEMIFNASGVPCVLFDAGELSYYVLNPDADPIITPSREKKTLY